MFVSKEGQQVPQVTFPVRQGDSWVNVTTDELFKGKTVIVFSLPGAFTPTVHQAIYLVTTNCSLYLKSTEWMRLFVSRSMIRS